MRPAIIWTSAHPINWRIYASLGGYELTDITFTLLDFETI